MSKSLQTYQEFWPYYLRQHACCRTRLLHYLGTGLALALLATAAITQNAWWVVLAVVTGYLFAWIGHVVFERNKPATFGHPGWSFISDWRMFFLCIGGKLQGELDKYGIVSTEAQARDSVPTPDHETGSTSSSSRH